MNERIRELALQATMIKEVKCEGYLGRSYTRQDEYFDKEKFAQLIVAECSQALNPMLRDMISRGRAVELIKERFGIE
jgi:hypothetical protein